MQYFYDFEKIFLETIFYQEEGIYLFLFVFYEHL